MSGTGVGQNVYLFGGTGGTASTVSEGNALFVQPKVDKVKNVGRFVIRSGTPTRLPDLPTLEVYIFNEQGNDIMWIGGIDEDAPAVRLGAPLYEGKMATYPVNNLNQLSVIGTTDKQEIFVQAMLAGQDTDLTPNDPAAPDTTPPTVSVRSPASGATNQEWNVNVIITMSEAVDPLTVDSTTVTFQRVTGLLTIPATVSVDSADPTKIIIDPTSDLTASTAYRVTVTTAVKDLQENALAAPDTWDFTTKAAPPPADTTAPIVTTTSPTNNATSVVISNPVTVTFSEQMLESSFSATSLNILLASNSQALSGTARNLSSDKKTVTITGQSLSYSTSYILRILGGSSGVKDLAGNPLASTQNIAFSTQSSPTNIPYSVAGNTYDKLYDDNYTETSLKIVNASSSLNGQKPKIYKIDIHRYGTISGNYSVLWYRGSSLFRTLKTASVSALPNNAVNVVTIDDSTNTTAFQAGDRIIVRFTGSGDNSNHLRVRISSTDVKDGNNTINQKNLGGFFTIDYESNDLAMTIECSTT